MAGMLESTTQKMLFAVGSIAVGALIITGAKTVFPAMAQVLTARIPTVASITSPDVIAAESTPFTYTYSTTDNTASVDKYTGSGPEFASGSQLKEIGVSCFNNDSSLSQIVLPDGIATLDDFAFASSGLTSITLPDSVTTIGQGSFDGCGELASATLSQNLQEIPQDAFAFTVSLKEVHIPASVQTIGYSAFIEVDNHDGSQTLDVYLPKENQTKVGYYSNSSSFPAYRVLHWI